MARKLLAVATTLIVTTGLIVGSASAGPGAQSTPAQVKGPLQVVAKKDVPFAATKALPEKSQEDREAQAPPSASRKPSQGKVEGRLAEQLAAAAKGDQFDVLVTTAGDPYGVLASLGPSSVKQTFSSALTGFAARLTAEQIRALQAKADVESIGLNEVVKATDDTASYWTGVTQLKDDFALTGDMDGWHYGYSGRDIVIAVIDTGIDTGHDDLHDKVIGWADMINDSSEPYDDNGHGTHVASIAAGAGNVNPLMQGVAPGAALVGVKVLDADGSGTYASVIGGIDWAVEHKNEFNIRIIKTNLF